MKTLLFFLALIIVVRLEASCELTRAALDIGSGTTKMKVAKIDLCKGSILKVIYEAQEKINFKEDLQKSKTETLSQSIMDEGELKIKSLVDKAKEVGATDIVGVATSASRTATNGISFIKKLTESLKIKLKILTQREEGIVGYYAAKTKVDYPEENLVVWDIGGGSQQMVYKKGDDFSVYEGKLASVSFKNHLVKDIQKRKGSTPNPITQKYYKKSLHDVRVVAKFSVPQDFKLRYLDPKTIVVGIGGVHNYSVGSQVGTRMGESYSLNNLRSVSIKNVMKKDKDIKSEYRETEVSNLILVQGFMEELGITKVLIHEASLADGVLVMKNL